MVSRLLGNVGNANCSEGMQRLECDFNHFIKLSVHEWEDCAAKNC